MSCWINRSNMTPKHYRLLSMLFIAYIYNMMVRSYFWWHEVIYIIGRGEIELVSNQMLQHFFFLTEYKRGLKCCIKSTTNKTFGYLKWMFYLEVNNMKNAQCLFTHLTLLAVFHYKVFFIIEWQLYLCDYKPNSCAN